MRREKRITEHGQDAVAVPLVRTALTAHPLFVVASTLVEGLDVVSDGAGDSAHNFHAVHDFKVVGDERDQFVRDLDEDVDCFERAVEPVIDEAFAVFLRDMLQDGVGVGLVG